MIIYIFIYLFLVSVVAFFKSANSKKTYITPSGSSPCVFIDTLNQPHTMIAGATGSGKSVIINGLIYTALYSLPIDTDGGKQFILIDPKRVELSQYKKLPHTICYASEPEQMINALEYALSITESRFKLMQKHGLHMYNSGDLYVIIDEFADLMLTNGKRVKPIIQRLSQIGRAAKVHIILATQCPLVTVIPTAIKVNFDCVWALHTATPQHSRNIMNKIGCESLPRYGQGYYMKGSDAELYNVPYVPKESISTLIDYWTSEKCLLNKQSVTPSIR